MKNKKEKRIITIPNIPDRKLIGINPGSLTLQKKHLIVALDAYNECLATNYPENLIVSYRGIDSHNEYNCGVMVASGGFGNYDGFIIGDEIKIPAMNMKLVVQKL